jgi:mannose-6-phosphate isomerase
LVPAGTVHAIGPGLLLAEIQQPNPCTFRLFDYGSGRALHVDEALAATSLSAEPSLWRPLDPPRAVLGDHIGLEPVAGGRRELGDGQLPALVVPVRDEVRLGDEHVAPGDLRLCVGGPVELSVARGGLAVVGTCAA